MAAKAKTKTTSKVAKAKPATIHIKGRADKDTFCGGSHSPIWHKARKSLSTTEPRNAKKATCGRCIRVAKSKELL